jgi:protein O-mannosyl-transferase
MNTIARRADTVQQALGLATLTIVNIAIWGGSIQNAFVFDDLPNIIGNRWITDWRTVPEAFAHHAAGFDARFNTSYYRPLMHVFHAATYAAAGPVPWAFHLVNVLLHVAAVLCAYLLIGAMLRLWSDPSRFQFLPLIGALVFSVHPVHTEAVAWVAGITDLSYTVLGLGALAAYVRAFSDRSFAAVSAVLLLASMLSKEAGASVLVLMAWLEWIEARCRQSWSLRAAGTRLGPALVATAVYLVMRVTALGSFAPSAAQHPQSLGQTGITAAGLFARYLGLLAAPVELNVMRSIPPTSRLSEPIVLTGVAACIALLAIVVRFRRQPLALLPVAVMILPILPVLYTPAIESGGTVFGERYLYLPVLGVGCCVGLALEEGRRRFSWGWFASVAVMALLVLSGAATAVARTRVWADSLTLWTDAAMKSPNSAAAQEGFCFALYNARQLQEALRACEHAIALDSTRVDARINRATTLLALGRAQEALWELEAALSRRPDSPDALVIRGLACMVLGRTDEALASYGRALEVDPAFAEAHNDFGVALVRLGRTGEALVHFEEAVRIAPENADYQANLQACPR